MKIGPLAGARIRFERGCNLDEIICCALFVSKYPWFHVVGPSPAASVGPSGRNWPQTSDGRPKLVVALDTPEVFLREIGEKV